MISSWKESPGITMPLLGAAAGAIYGATKERKKQPLLFAFVGAGAGVFLGVFMGSTSSWYADHRVGATSTEIFTAQMRLGRLGYHVQPTGVFDDATKSALKSFQATYSLLIQDGSLTQEVIAYLTSLSKQPPPPWTPESGTYQEAITRQT